jgi:hypothetical protein
MKIFKIFNNVGGGWGWTGVKEDKDELQSNELIKTDQRKLKR